MILFGNCVTNTHYFRIDVLECASGGAPRRICIDACTPDAVGGLTEDVTAHAVILRLWGSSASPKRRVMVARQCPMRPPLVRRADGVMMQ